MRYIPARPFYNNTRQLLDLLHEVTYFEVTLPFLITALRRPISSYTAQNHEPR